MTMLLARMASQMRPAKDGNTERKELETEKETVEEQMSGEKNDTNNTDTNNATNKLPQSGSDAPAHDGVVTDTVNAGEWKTAKGKK